MDVKSVCSNLADYAARKYCEAILANENPIMQKNVDDKYTIWNANTFMWGTVAVTIVAIVFCRYIQYYNTHSKKFPRDFSV